MIFAAKDMKLEFFVFEKKVLPGFGIFDSEEKLKLDEILIAVGFEILKNDIYEAEQLIKDYIDCEEKEYVHMIDEYEALNLQNR